MSVLKKVGALLSHVFLPERSNNQRPRLLHPAGLSVLVAIFLLNYSLRPLISYLPGFILGFSSSITTNEVIALTNQERAKAGLSPLVANPRLSQAAQAKAVDMFASDYWSHVSPSGTQPWKFIKDTGYTYRYAGENLGRDFSDTSSLVSAWMSSPTHKENIVSNRYQDIGVAVVDGNLQGVETRLVVQLFATPTPAPPPVAQVQPQPQPPAQVPATLLEEETVIKEEEVVITEEIQPAPSLEETGFIAEGTEKQEPKAQFVGTTIAQTVGQKAREERIISPTEITQAFGMILVTLILATLVADWVIAHRRKTVRLVGRNWAHITYMGVIALMMIQYAQGRIL
jgi:hypothetical protein